MRSIHLLLISLCLFCLSEQTALFENKSVIKTVDLSGSIVKVTLSITVKPLQDSLTEYFIGIPKSEVEHMAYIQVMSKKNIVFNIVKAENQDK